MPTSTFENLPGEKRQCIIDAAIDEFAERRFSDASINRIIKAAGISRGSFYQYFKDKEDLYTLIIDIIGKEKLGIMERHPSPDENATFFEAVIASLPAMVEWLSLSPKYNEIGRRMAQDDSEFIRRVVLQFEGRQQSILEYLRQDRQRGLIREDVELELVIQLLMSTSSSLLREYYQEGGAQMALERIKQTLDIIVNGIAEKG